MGVRAIAARAVTAAAFVSACAALAGCAPTAPLPHREDRGAPSDGELAVYDVVATADGTLIGRVATRWDADPRGLSLSRGPANELVEAPSPKGAVTVDRTSFEVLGRWSVDGDARTEATWDATRGVIVMKGPGIDATIPVPAGTRENDEMLEAMRFAGLAPGASLRGAVFNTQLRAWVPVHIDVLAPTDVETPAGTFRAVDHRVGFGTQYHHAFIEEAPPHRLVRYDNASGTSLTLRGHRASKADPRPIETAPVELPKAAPKASLVLATLLVQWPLMIGLPLWLAFRMRKRFGLPWSIWGLGVLGFILSQVVHLPLNWALGLSGGGRGVGMASPPVVAGVLGLTAGLCEEVVRWAVLHRIARRGHLGVRVGVFAGAGHGGVEALIFGVLAAINAIVMWALPFVPPSWVGIPPEARDAVARQLVLYWASSWDGPVLAGVERVSAILFHIGMSVLLAYGISTKRALPCVALAVAAHAVFDGVIVYLVPRIGIYAVEGLALAVSLVLGGLVVRALRRAGPLEAEFAA